MAVSGSSLHSSPSDDHIRQAFALHQGGELAQAETLYRDVLARHPDNLNALQLLGALAHATGRTEEAIALFECALATLSSQGGGTAKHAALYHNLGNALRDAGRGANAVTCYRRGLALDPQLPELHANLGRALTAQDDFDGAVASCESAVALDPGNHGYALHLAKAYAAAGRHDEAIGMLQDLLRIAPDHAEVLGHLGRVLTAAGRLDDAIAAFRAATASDPSSCPARLDLAAALVLGGETEAAVEILAALAIAHPDEPSIHWELATALHALNRPEDALAPLARVLALRPDDAHAHLLMGGIHQTLGNLHEAMGSCRAALRAKPDMGEALLRLAMVLADLGQPAEAIEACRRLLAAEPENAAALCVLGGALARAGQPPAALDAYAHCLRLKPDYLAAQYQLGVLLRDMGQHAMAAACLQAAIELEPDHAGAHVELGNVLQALGRADEALASYVRAQALRPLTRFPSAKAEPDFSVLVMIAPGAGNTPYKYLIGKSSYEAHFYALLPGVAPNVDLLRANGDIVVNLISDVDQGRDILTSAEMLVDRLQRPVVNHPRKVLSTGRDVIAERLSAIPHCRMPRTARRLGHEVAALAETFGFPVLLRMPGTHGGDAFEKIESAAEIDAFLSQYPGDEYYVTEYVDYRSADGYFRKYRMMLVDGVVLPYHLAIADQWKIHHFRTEMGSHRWMQREEEAFLDNPGAVFTEAHDAALREIGRIVGLDFFGVDCSSDRDGNVLIFEVNASMLIHDDNAQFAYKAPHVARIKAVFDAMLARQALAARIPRAPAGRLDGTHAELAAAR
jgi:tetratricopeptide (TPR) repeat protein/glutathione synthase/RimK-type ligase-like ATP-grasp enzyme